MLGKLKFFFLSFFHKNKLEIFSYCFFFFSELLMLSDNMKSEMLKQTTCDYIANNLGNVMETTVCLFINFKNSTHFF